MWKIPVERRGKFPEPPKSQGNFDCPRNHRRSWHTITTPFFNFLFTYLFSIKFLYFFIISSLLPYFNLFVSIFIQSYVNSNLHVLILCTCIWSRKVISITRNFLLLFLFALANHTQLLFQYILQKVKVDWQKKAPNQ